jgi:hypothetical protein
MSYVLIGIFTAIGLALIALKARRLLPGAKLGDFVRVPIPRSTSGRSLAMGTRLDVAAALKKAGTPPDELRRLIDARDDDELLRRYWAHHDAQSVADSADTSKKT